jgi:hypothetical protein
MSVSSAKLRPWKHKSQVRRRPRATKSGTETPSIFSIICADLHPPPPPPTHTHIKYVYQYICSEKKAPDNYIRFTYHSRTVCKLLHVTLVKFEVAARFLENLCTPCLDRIVTTCWMKNSYMFRLR